MRILSTLFLALFSTLANCQIDSSWFAENYLPRFYKDTGTYLQEVSFLDEGGKEKTLSEFKGKILYVDMWSMSCGPCIAMFPYQEQLLKRLKAMHLDSTVLFVNINAEDSKKKWKKGLRKYHPTGINLYINDTSLYTRWNVDALPCYILLDTSGKVLGKGIVGPDAGMIGFSTVLPKGFIPWRQYGGRIRKIILGALHLHSQTRIMRNGMIFTCQPSWNLQSGERSIRGFETVNIILRQYRQNERRLQLKSYSVVINCQAAQATDTGRQTFDICRKLSCKPL